MLQTQRRKDLAPCGGQMAIWYEKQHTTACTLKSAPEVDAFPKAISQKCSARILPCTPHSNLPSAQGSRDAPRFHLGSSCLPKPLPPASCLPHLLAPSPPPLRHIAAHPLHGIPTPPPAPRPSPLVTRPSARSRARNHHVRRSPH